MVEEDQVRSLCHPRDLGRGSMLVKHKVVNKAEGLEQEKGRDGVCGEGTFVGRKPQPKRSRPRRAVSKGVRIYFHYVDRVVTRKSYNQSRGSVALVEFYRALYPFKAIGNEEGAIAIHLDYPFTATAADRIASRALATAKRSA